MHNVIDLENGFAVEEKSGRREFRDEQVSNLRLSYERKYSEGHLKARERWFTIWVKNEPKPFHCVDIVKVARTDKLDPLIQRLSQKFQSRLSALLKSGKSLPGAGFKLDQNSLTIGKAGKESVIPIAKLVTMDVIDEKLCVWKAGQDDPIFRLPFESKNVYPLSLALKGLIPDKTAEQPESFAAAPIMVQRNQIQTWGDVYSNVSPQIQSWRCLSFALRRWPFSPIKREPKITL